MKVGALIPCRSGSKGIPNKNFKDFCGKPLWHWTLGEVVKSNIFDKIIVSSDGGIKNDHPIYMNLIIDNDRPMDFATDEARLDPLLFYYMGKYPDIDIWCLLQPTSPLRTGSDIKGAFKKICKERYESVVSVYNEKGFYWIKDCIGFMGMKIPVATYHVDRRPNRSERKNWFSENGAIYFTKKIAIKATGHRLGGQVGLYVMPKERSFEIDEQIDWFVCESLMNKRLRRS